MAKENIFSEIFEKLSAEDKVQLLGILRQYPEYFEYLLENYKRKKESVKSGDQKKIQEILKDEKSQLIELINKNFNSKENA